MQNITHAEAIVQFDRLKALLEKHKLMLRVEWTAPSGRLFLINDHNDDAERIWIPAFSCSSIQELDAWYKGFLHAKGLRE